MPRLKVGFMALRVLSVSTTLGILLLVGAAVAAAQTPQGATLTPVSGTTAVVKADGTTAQPAPSGMTLAPGDQIGTLANSTALVTFFEGSELEIGSNSTVVLKEIRSSGNEVHVLVENVLGLAIVRVEAFANPASDFRLQNPGGSVVALARGSTLVEYVREDSSVGAGFTNCTHAPCKVSGFGLTVERLGSGLIICNALGNCDEFPLNSIYEDPIEEIIENLENPKSDDGKPDDDEHTYETRVPTPLSDELARSRLGTELDPFSAGGSMLALGMIGWTLFGYRPRNRR